MMKLFALSMSFVQVVGLCFAMMGATVTSVVAQGSDELILRDSECEGCIYTLIAPIMKVAKMPYMRIFIVNSPMYNAGASTRHRIFINTGLILVSQDVWEFLAVMAHEIGHIQCEHLAKLHVYIDNIQNQSLYNTIFAALIGGLTRSAEGAIASMVISQDALLYGALSFMREHEYAADQAALGYFQQLDWSTDAFVKVFERLMTFDGGQECPWLRTHPMSQDRLKNLKTRSTYIRRAPKKELQEAFERLKMKLHAYVNPQQPALEVAEPLMTYQLGLKALYSGDYRAANRYLQRYATLSTGSHLQAYAYEALAQSALETQQLQEAYRYFLKAFIINDKDALIRIGLVGVLLQFRPCAENARLALKMLSTFTSAQTEDLAMVYYYRAIAYGFLEDRAMMALCLADYRLHTNDLKLAREQCRRAQLYIKPMTREALYLSELKEAIQRAEKTF